MYFDQERQSHPKLVRSPSPSGGFRPLVTPLLVLCFLFVAGVLVIPSCDCSAHSSSPHSSLASPFTSFTEASTRGEYFENETVEDDKDASVWPMVISAVAILVIVVAITYFTLQEQDRQKKERKEKRRRERREEWEKKRREKRRTEENQAPPDDIVE